MLKLFINTIEYGFDMKSRDLMLIQTNSGLKIKLLNY